MKREGDLTLEVMKSITAKGGEEEVGRVLRERGRTEEDTVAIPVLVWNQTEKRLKGSAWRVRGQPVETVTEATDLWEGLMVNERKVNVSLTFSLHKFVFPATGELRANSGWLSFEVRYEEYKSDWT